jgi:CxxC motif-containing protein (DUF1111 family)
LTAVAVGAAAVVGSGLHAGGDGVRTELASSGLPGGAATSRNSVNNRNAFSHSSGNLTFKQQFDFKLGNAIFRKLWVSAPSSSKSSDGLGPLYNARSCQHCHLKDGRGHPPQANWPDDNAVSMFLRLSIPPRNERERKLIANGRANVIAEPTYGGQLQDIAIQGHSGEAHMHITYRDTPVRLGDGETVVLRTPTYRITDLQYGPLDPKVLISPRIAPQMIGMGLVEAIPANVIIKGEDPDDRDGDGISGRANRSWSLEHKRVVLGRFGWKAGTPSVLQQTAQAFADDMGLSSRLVPRPAGDCTPRQSVCRQAPDGRNDGREEVSDQFLKLVAFYVRNLAVPRRRDLDRPQVKAGGRLFREIGCAACHTPSFKTGHSAVSPHLSGQTIWPYTDLLLHDMGPGLADGRPEGRASGSEWRTAPLWGVGLTQTVSGHTYFLHDGRARNLEEAILWHGGEGQASRDRFAALDKADRDRLLAFVNSL